MKFEKYSKPLLRISLSLLFIYFGIQQLTAPEAWTSFVPSTMINFGMSAKTLVLMNSFLELSLGLLLLIGLYTRISSIILSIHLFLIAISMGLNPLAIRDTALALATLVVFLNGPDRLSLDKRLTKKGNKFKKHIP